MLRGGAASWWEGATALDGGAKFETPDHSSARRRSEALERTAKTELFGHLRIRPHHNPETEAPSNRKRTDLVAFNDG